ncbi:carbonic anhydrase [Brevundimonas goettingensis]|uniref:Carbonic anhydrase n=1 Tax=Brevundimonas goettingensis TaxID=2774190 RepID=A0A975C4N4_9CAUL|nr:carbonic anhydrase [Brevundimonas goettingensis]QTC92404.1 carbonic anhydrase [Brevundimonas goettingensis]
MGFLWFGRKKPSRGSTPAVSLDFAASPDPEVVVAGAVAAAAAALTPHPSPTPDEALQMLRDGNAAFLSGASSLGHVTAHDLDALQGGHKPIATIVGCADSRTPPTILFNQGLGKLFIIRVAGNTVDRRGLSSIVYAVKHLSCPLVVVMGHTGCGAVAAAEAVVDGKAELDPSLEEMIVPILPAVLSARKIGGPDQARLAVEENARRVVARLLTADTALAQAVDTGAIRIVAAVKDMVTGRVDFLDLPDEPAPAHH